MGIKLEYRDSNGRNVSQKQWMDSLQKEALGAGMKELEKQLHGQIAAMRCPVHNAAPRVKTKIDGNVIKSEITACCEDMQTKAQMVASNQA